MPALCGFFYVSNPQGGAQGAVMSEEKTYTQDEVNALIEKEVEGLKKNNAELKAEKKKLQDQQGELSERLKALEDAADEAERIKAEKDGDVKTAVEKVEAKLRKELAAKDAEKSSLQGQLQTLLVDNGLNEALTKAGVAPQYMDAAKALLRTKHKVEIVDSEGQPTAQIEGKSLAEAVSEWAQGDHGKHFIAAPSNSGGGAQGANGNGRAATGKPVKDWSVGEKSAYIREHGKDAYLKLAGIGTDG